jgi:protein-disulfide isomerase
MIKRFPAKFLVIFTSISCLVTVSLVLVINYNLNPEPIPLYTQGQPTLGLSTAKVHVVVFEDPTCNHCILYHNQNYTKLYDSYIHPGLIRYTVYLVADLPSSPLITKFLLCIANQSPESFFTLLHKYYANPPLAVTDKELSKELVGLAKQSDPALSLKSLTSCISSQSMDTQVKTNTEYAQIIMGGIITTPTVFVNGIRLTRPSYKELTTLINTQLKK